MQRGDQVPLWLRRRPQFPPLALPSGALLQEEGCCPQMVLVRGAWTLGSRGRRGWGCLERAGHSRRPAAPHPKRPPVPRAASEVPPTRRRLRQPYLRPSRSRACGAGRSLRVAGRTKQKLPSSAPLSALPARRRPRLRTKRNRLRLSEQRQGLPQWKLRLGAGSEPPCDLQSLTWLRIPKASATDRVPPTPTRTHRSWQPEQPRVRHGAGFRGALGPPIRASGGRGRASAVCGFPLVTPGDTHLLLSPSSCPQTPPPTQLTGLALPGPAQLSPQQRQLLDRAVAGGTSGTTRVGQGRTASRRSQEWRRRCADKCRATGTVPAPVACRLPRGCAEAARSPGVPAAV